MYLQYCSVDDEEEREGHAHSQTEVHPQKHRGKEHHQPDQLEMEGGREGGREGGQGREREGEREGGREGRGREGKREGEREGEREGGRAEEGREREREREREGEREGGRAKEGGRRKRSREEEREGLRKEKLQGVCNHNPGRPLLVCMRLYYILPYRRMRV